MGQQEGDQRERLYKILRNIDIAGVHRLLDIDGLSPEKFAEKVGISRVGVESWLRGRSRMHDNSIEKITEVYGPKILADKFFDAYATEASSAKR
jgi:transcriptional regulator with XRE-family HTH domain